MELTKIERIKKLTNEEEVINYLMNSSEIYLKYVNELWDKLSFRTDFEKIKLIDKIVDIRNEDEFKENDVFIIFVNKYILENLTCGQQIELIDKYLEKNETTNNIVTIIWNMLILDCEEFVESDYDINLLGLILIVGMMDITNDEKIKRIEEYLINKKSSKVKIYS